MTLPSSVMPVLAFFLAPSEVPAAAAAGATVSLAAALLAAGVAGGMADACATTALELLLACGVAAGVLANHALWMSAPSMPAKGTGTPLAPLNIDATPTPESATIANASPTSLSATGAQTLFRNVARVRPNQEGRAAGASGPPPSSPRGSASAGEKWRASRPSIRGASTSTPASRAVEAAGDTQASSA